MTIATVPMVGGPRDGERFECTVIAQTIRVSPAPATAYRHMTFEQIQPTQTEAYHLISLNGLPIYMHESLKADQVFGMLWAGYKDKRG